MEGWGEPEGYDSGNRDIYQIEEEQRQEKLGNLYVQREEAEMEKDALWAEYYNSQSEVERLQGIYDRALAQDMSGESRLALATKQQLDKANADMNRARDLAMDAQKKYDDIDKEYNDLDHGVNVDENAWQVVDINR